MQSTNRNNFFQTSSSLTASTRRDALSKNRAGNPIALTSKILALLADPDDEGAVYVGESGGIVRRLDLRSRKTTQTYRGPTAPVSSLALSTSSLSPVKSSVSSNPHKSTTLYAGSWDKSVHSWSLTSHQPLKRLYGHSDFVKCLLVTRLPSVSGAEAGEAGEEVLVSGGADGKVIVWRLPGGEKLHVVRAHERGVFTLALDPCGGLFDRTSGKERDEAEKGEGKDEDLVLYTAGSDPGIKRWRLSSSSITAIPFPVQVRPTDPSARKTHQDDEEETTETLEVHATSVNCLIFSPSASSLGLDIDPEDVKLYTASSDNTSLILTRTDTTTTTTATTLTTPNQSSTSTTTTTPSPNPLQSTTWHASPPLPHPTYVRSILPSPTTNLLATASRDGGIRIWDTTTSDSDAADLQGTYWGHFDEVTCLALARIEGREKVVSAGIDGTVRVWGFCRGEVGGAPSLGELIELGDGGGSGEEDVVEGEGEGKGQGMGKGKGGMTDEEEAELAELMDDED
ncbi:MAG: hypothetical protein M1828_003183 [Chrysothrix sp. TS-e1954]|nr:MAG: hypothetical protein M1828_003183 [Chrysothrix sp. TS-e1954]